MNEQNISTNKFGLWQKWFWVGIVMSIPFSFPGLIYGIVLALEKENRKSGLIIIAFSIVWYVALSLFTAWLTASGFLPHYQVLQFK
jgi:hypothetical protein